MSIILDSRDQSFFGFYWDWCGYMAGMCLNVYLLVLVDVDAESHDPCPLSVYCRLVNWGEELNWRCWCAIPGKCILHMRRLFNVRNAPASSNKSAISACLAVKKQGSAISRRCWSVCWGDPRLRPAIRVWWPAAIPGPEPSRGKSGADAKGHRWERRGLLRYRGTQATKRCQGTQNGPKLSLDQLSHLPIINWTLKVKAVSFVFNYSPREQIDFLSLHSSWRSHLCTHCCHLITHWESSWFRNAFCSPPRK